MSRYRRGKKIVLPLGKYGIGVLPGIPASIVNIWEDGLSPIPASIEIWVLIAPKFCWTQKLLTPPSHFEVIQAISSNFGAILSGFDA